MDAAQKATLAMLAKLVLEAIEASGPMGLPGGLLYNALATSGVTFAQYESLMSVFTLGGIVVRRNHCYFPGPKAKELQAELA